MSTGMKVLIACVAVVGGLFALNLLLGLLFGLFHWLVIGVVVLAIGYVVVRIASSNDRTLSGNRRALK